MDPSILTAMREFIHQTAYSLHGLILFPMIFFSILFYLLAISGLIQKQTKRKRIMNCDWPKVTVQIPTYNEPVALRCAKRCLEFDYPKDRLEIIIGDDSTDSNVSRMIDEFAKKHDIVKVTRRGNNEGFKAGNLNNMLKHSNGEIIVIFDSDFIPSKDFLKRVIPPFLENEKIGCVQTKWNYMNIKQNRTSKLASTILMVYHNLLAPLNHKNNVSLLFGSGQAIRKELLKKLGGWQNGSLTEDVEFSIRVLKMGYKIHYLKDVSTSGEVPFTVRGLFKQQKRWAFGNTKAFLQHAKWILFSKTLSSIQKSTLIFTLLGYISAPILVLFTLSGFISFMTGEPAPINIYKFLTQTGWTMFVSSGFLAAMFVALFKEGKLKIAHSVIGASLTIGFLVSIGVCMGVLKALLGRRMNWYMIPKIGNERSSLKL